MEISDDLQRIFLFKKDFTEFSLIGIIESRNIRAADPLLCKKSFEPPDQHLLLRDLATLQRFPVASVNFFISCQHFLIHVIKTNFLHAGTDPVLL